MQNRIHLFNSGLLNSFVNVLESLFLSKLEKQKSEDSIVKSSLERKRKKKNKSEIQRRQPQHERQSFLNLDTPIGKQLDEEEEEEEEGGGGANEISFAEFSEELNKAQEKIQRRDEMQIAIQNAKIIQKFESKSKKQLSGKQRIKLA